MLKHLFLQNNLMIVKKWLKSISITHAEKITAFIDANQDKNLYISRTSAIIHYLNVMTHNPLKWTSEATTDTRNKLIYYWRNKHYLPNLKLDKYLQDILKKSHVLIHE